MAPVVAPDILLQRALRLGHRLRSWVQRDSIIKGGKSTDVGDSIRSREAEVYISGNWVYKAYSRQDKAEEARDALAFADTVGVTVSDWKYYKAKLDQSGVKIDVYVIQSRKLDGQVFFAAKKGGVSKFAGAIADIDDTKKLRLMLRVLLAAKENGLTDPQGFVTTSGTLVFFDVHIGKGTGQAVDGLIDAVNDRLEKLG